MRIVNLLSTFRIWMTVISITLLLSQTAFAAVYYVDRNHRSANDSNPGTQDKPWRTIQKSANTAKAGDTVYVKYGVYNEWVNVKNSGTSSSPIVFKAYSSERPIIDGKGIDVPTWKGLFNSDGKSYITLEGFEVRNSDEVLIRLRNGSNLTVRNCKAHSNYGGRSQASGIFIDHCNKGLVERCEVYNTNWNALTAESTNNVVFRYNYAHSNLAHVGINIFPNTTETQSMYSGNDVLYNTITGCRVGIYMRYQKDNKIIGNLVYKNGDPKEHGTGNGICLGYNPKEPSSNQVYRSNTVIYNNTVVGNLFNGLQNDSANYLIIKNNIFSHNGLNQLLFRKATTGHTINYNLYYSPFKVKWNDKLYTSLSSLRSGIGQESKGIDGNPYYKNTSGNDYSLDSRSAAIDTGENLSGQGVTRDLKGTSRPQGYGFDIGAYEFTDSTGTPSSPTNLKVISAQ